MSIDLIACTFPLDEPPHPDLGQGANIAIEDAEALATLLQDVHKDDSAAVANALSTFFTLRKPRADYIQLNSRLASGVLTEEEAQRVGPFNPAEFSKVRAFSFPHPGAQQLMGCSDRI